MKFNEGDTVITVSDTVSHNYGIGRYLTVRSTSASNVNVFEGTNYCNINDIILISNKNMNIKEKFVHLFLSEPEKSFRKVGITSGDGALTADGQNIFLTWLLQKNGSMFKKEVVDELLKEEDK